MVMRSEAFAALPEAAGASGFGSRGDLLWRTLDRERKPMLVALLVLSSRELNENRHVQPEEPEL